MKPCPFCLGEIPAQARKCQHCGEWVDDRAKFSALNREEPYNVVLYKQMMFSVFKLGSVVVGSAVFTALVIVFCKYTCWCGF